MDTFDLTNLSQLTCPSGKKDNIIIFNIISYLLLYYKGWWKRGGTESLSFTSTPFPTSQSVGITDDVIPKDLSKIYLVVVRLSQNYHKKSNNNYHK